MALPDSTLQTVITAVVTLVTSLSPHWLIALGAALAGIGVIRLIPAASTTAAPVAPTATPTVPAADAVIAPVAVKTPEVK